MKTILSSKRNHHLARVSILLIVVALIAGMVGCGGGGGGGPAMEIRSWHDLSNIRNNLTGNYILMNDLDSTTAGYEELASPTANDGKGWQPIGFAYAYPFTGTFDGQGYEIRHLYINRPDEGDAGLFNYVDGIGRIEHVGLVDVAVIGREGVGGLVGQNWGTVSNSYSTGNVTGDSDVGGLVGANIFGTVTSSYSSGNATGSVNVGSLVGRNHNGTVSNSYAAGSVSGQGNVGGLVGAHWGTISNSYYNYDEVLINGENIFTIGALFNEDFEEWLGNGKFLDISGRLSKESGYYLVSNMSDFKQLLAFGQNASLRFRLANDLDLTTEPNFYIPYLAGEFDGDGYIISNLSFNFDSVGDVGLFGYLDHGGTIIQVGVKNSNITGTDSVGGLVGLNGGGTISNSYAAGSVTGVTYIGGLVGLTFGFVNESYSVSNVTGTYYAVGGLTGDNRGTVNDSYSTGNVTGGSAVGGLVGTSLGGTVTNSFWDTETSGQSTSAGGTGKTTAEMQDINTFSGATWNIVEVANPSTRNPSYLWNIVNNVTYPFLSWQPL